MFRLGSLKDLKICFVTVSGGELLFKGRPEKALGELKMGCLAAAETDVGP